MTGEGPTWLSDFQARFGGVIRTPLDRSTGTLSVTHGSYDPPLVEDAVGGTIGLSVYNRQYWFRLFEVLQGAFPLTTRLVGPWGFNEYASRFLLETPPRGWDVDRAADGFDRFFEDAVGCEPKDESDAWIDAVRIDAAWREVLRAPPSAAYRPSPEDAARLLDAHLLPSPAVALFWERYPLASLRERPDPHGVRAPVPPRLPHPRAWALFRTDRGISRIPIEPREAELHALLRVHTIRDALARLERACPHDERDALPRKAQAWLARSVERGFWVGFEVEPSD